MGAKRSWCHAPILQRCDVAQHVLVRELVQAKSAYGLAKEIKHAPVCVKGVFRSADFYPSEVGVDRIRDERRCGLRRVLLYGNPYGCRCKEFLPLVFGD